MMTKNGIFWTIFTTILISTAQAAVKDHDQNQMIDDQNAVTELPDEQNDDSISRFGQTQKHVKFDSQVAIPIAPIDEESFESKRANELSRNLASTPNSKAQSEKPEKQKLTIKEKVRSVQEVGLIVNDTGFFPATIFLTEGIPARIFITGASSKSQCFILDQFGVRRQIKNQKIEEIAFVPDQSGSFSFSCPMSGAKGSLIVKDSESPRMRVPAGFDSRSQPLSVPVSVRDTKLEKPSQISDSDFEIEEKKLH